MTRSWDRHRTTVKNQTQADRDRAATRAETAEELFQLWLGCGVPNRLDPKPGRIVNGFPVSMPDGMPIGFCPPCGCHKCPLCGGDLAPSPGTARLENDRICFKRSCAKGCSYAIDADRAADATIREFEAMEVDEKDQV